jgi:A/G-specific adenine glycosylase
MKPNRQSAIGNRQLSRLVPLLLDWFSKNARDLPWRHTRDPYAIWVSEIMLQQTQVKTVIPFWNRWMQELPTIGAAARASPAKIHKLWEGLGYYTRVRNLQKAAQAIVANHDGRFPEKFEDVLALPGIGRYTAGAICSIAFNQPTPILDGNVIRVMTRIFGIAENPKEKETHVRLWRLAGEMVGRAVPSPPRRGEDTAPYLDNSCSFLNQSLMELGALICTPRNLRCPICPVRKLCVAFRHDRIAELPNLGKRTVATKRRFVAFIVERNGRFLVRQRPAGVVNAQLWEFPNVEIAKGESDPKLAAKGVFGIEPVQIQPLSIVKHSITRYRITLEGYRVLLAKQPRAQAGVWKSPAQMQRLAFTAAHKKLASFATDCILSGR